MKGSAQKQKLYPIRRKMFKVIDNHAPSFDRLRKLKILWFVNQEKSTYAVISKNEG